MKTALFVFAFIFTFNAVSEEVPQESIDRITNRIAVLNSLDSLKESHDAACKAHPRMFGGSLKGILAKTFAGDGALDVTDTPKIEVFNLNALVVRGRLSRALYQSSEKYKWQTEGLNVLMPSAQDSPASCERKIAFLRDEMRNRVVEDVQWLHAGGYRLPPKYLHWIVLQLKKQNSDKSS